MRVHVRCLAVCAAVRTATFLAVAGCIFAMKRSANRYGVGRIPMLNALVQRAATLVAATLVAVALAACGGGGSDTTSPPPPPAGNVGPAGATITSADGNATLVIPPGALNTTITATLKPATPADGYVDDPQILAGTVYKLDAPETALSVPAAFSIALPASAAAATADTHRVHALAVIPANQDNFVGCYLQVFDPLSQNPSNFSFIGGFGKGANVPYQPGDLIVCAFANGDVNVDYGPNSNDVICPPGWGYRFQEYWDAPGYFRDTASGNVLEWPAGSGMGYITMCAPSPPAVVNVVSLLPAAKAVLGAASAPVSIPTMGPQILALFLDSTPPSVQLSGTVLPAANGMVTLHLVATASDNVGVTKVQLFDESIVTANLAHSNIFVDLKSNVATFTAPPYVWDSAPMSPDQLYAAHHSYSATAFDAAGNMKTATLGFSALTPAITSFVATPPTLPAGGGDVNLTWTTPPDTAANFSDTLAIDHGIGNVTGSAGATAHITSTTTFTITGTNPSGTGSATVTVTVAPPPAPTITSFTATPTSLPASGGNVTLAWTTSGASTVAIDHGVGTVSGDSGSVVANVTATTPFTLTATNAGGSTASTVTVSVAANGDRFVDAAAGLDTNDCSQPAPCKTIAKAMTGATSGSTVWLAPGVYAPATQGNGATVPDGVALKSSTAGAATLADGVTMTVAASSAINGIVLDTSNFACGVITANGTTGTPTLALTGVLIKCAGAINIAGNVSAVMTPGALANASYTAALPNSLGAIVSLAGAAQLTIQGGIIDGNHVGAPSFGGGFIVGAGSSTLTLSGVTLRNRTGTGIGLSEAANVVVNNNSLIDSVGVADNCPTASAIVIAGTGQVTVDHSQISSGASAAICVRNSTTASTITVTQSTIAHMANGITAEIGTGSTAVVTISGSSFTNNARGIFWNGFAGSSFDISGSTFTGNTVTAIDYEGFGSLKLRNSNVSSNTGQGVWLITNPIVDLGTAADPGGNTMTGNTLTSLQMNLSNVGTVQAAGNTWNANVQGADANGHYTTPTLKTGPASNGTNYQISNASVLSL